MNKRKILILLFVFTIAVGFAMASVSSVDAAKKTVKIKDSGGYPYSASIGKGDKVSVMYSSGYNIQYGKSRLMVIGIWGGHGPWGKYHYITKAKVTFKKSNGQLTTKTYKFKKSQQRYEICRQAPKGWKPIKAKIYYYKGYKKSSYY